VYVSIFLRVNLASESIQTQQIPEGYTRYGGRSLIARLLLDEVDPGCDPLGPNNLLIFAPGLLAGLSISSAGRLSIGAKSPLTGGIKEANVGGNAGDKLGRLGIKAILMEGLSSKDRLYLLHVNSQGAKLLPAGDYKGLGTYATTSSLQSRFGPDVSILAVGPAGEMGMRGAGVAVTDDLFGQPGRMAARGGLGAVMGNKRLKAIVIDDADAKAPPLHDPETFNEASRRFARELIESPKTGRQGSMHNYGTAAIMNAVQEIGALPTRNFSLGRFSSKEQIGPERLREVILERGGKIGQRCMAGCVIQCCNMFVDPKGEPIVSTLQFETLALMGSNLEIDDLDQIAHLNRTCNDLGLDTIEMGATLGIAMEAGLASFGDGQAASRLLKEVADGTPLGRILGNGAQIAGQVLGAARIPVARGQAFPGYDPRALKGNGVTYATSAMGADHTAGNTIGARNTSDPLSPAGKGELSRELQRAAAMLDMTGLCLFARPPVLADPELMVTLLNARYGWTWNVEDLVQAEDEVLQMEREFNQRVGFTPAHDRLPEIFSTEPLPPHNAVFNVSTEELARTVEGL
jgi:aldehyde:ferredoxin oxidoreductase